MLYSLHCIGGFVGPSFSFLLFVGPFFLDGPKHLALFTVWLIRPCVNRVNYLIQGSYVYRCHHSPHHLPASTAPAKEVTVLSLSSLLSSSLSSFCDPKTRTPGFNFTTFFTWKTFQKAIPFYKTTVRYKRPSLLKQSPKKRIVEIDTK